MPRVKNSAEQIRQQVKQDLRMGREHQQGRINWITTIVMGLFHVGAIAALFFFSWKNLAAFAIMYFFAINVGIGMAYHRLLTHRGYRTPKWLEYFVTACGTMALEGGPIFWVATHRVHHQNSDHEGDPHTPARRHLVGPRRLDPLRPRPALRDRAARPLRPRPHPRQGPRLALEVPLAPAHAHRLRADRHRRRARCARPPRLGGLSMMLWGTFLRVIVGLHATWLVNSATHLCGTRRFETHDDSPQQLVGRPPHRRRRLAQQPPRPPRQRAPRPRLVRVRHQLLRHLAALESSASPRKSRSPSSTPRTPSPPAATRSDRSS